MQVTYDVSKDLLYIRLDDRLRRLSIGVFLKAWFWILGKGIKSSA